MCIFHTYLHFWRVVPAQNLVSIFSINVYWREFLNVSKDPKICYTSKMATNPTGVSINILGIERGDQGHSCKEHDICHFVLSINITVWLEKVQWCIFLVGQNCHLFEVFIVINGVEMRRIMPHGLFVLLFLLWLIVVQNHYYFSPNSLLTFTHHNILPHLQVQICNVGIKETALAAYLVLDLINRCPVGFTS